MTDHVQAWRSIIIGEHKSWVIFENGTCVILMQPQEDLEQQAKALLAEYGPVAVASPSADFSIIHLEAYPGWVVTCHHPDILAYISPDEFQNKEAPQEVVIGLLGRKMRAEDARNLKVIHVEDKRTHQ